MIFLIEIPASLVAFACLHFVSVFWHCSCNKGAVSPACGSSYEQGHAGRYYRPLTGDPINIFCVDITHDIHTSGTCTANTQYHIPDAKGSLSGSCYAGGLASAITTNDLGSVTVTSIWDVVRDGGDGLTSGQVQSKISARLAASQPITKP